MSKTLIITEKPSAMKRIAESLSDKKPIKKVHNTVFYYEINHKNKIFLVGCAVGHLYSLIEKEKPKEDYLNFDLEWKPSYEISKNSEFSKKYLNTLKFLAKQSSGFIGATDLDTEGEIILKNILKFICKVDNAKRMRFSTLTKNDLIKSYENISPTIDIGLAESGETRHIMDFYFGIGNSRALTNSIKKATNRYKLMSTGRVQGPTLKVIVDKELEIKKFIPETYYQVQLKAKDIEAYHKKGNLKDKKEAEKILENTKGKKAIVKDIKKTEQKQYPPYPFDLTTLQIEAYRTLRIPPKITQSIAQSLYLAGVISYPRTSSHQLPPSLNYKSLLNKIARNNEYKELANELLKKPYLRPNNGKKTDPAHPCFTENTKIRFNDTNKTFKEIASKINKWKLSSNGSFYTYQNFNNIYSYYHNKNKIIKSSSYKIWKTQINTKIIKLHIKNKKIESTKNHEFYALTNDGLNYFKSANLEEGDYLFYKPSIEKEIYNLNINEKDILSSFSKKHIKDIKSGKNKKIIKTKKQVDKFFKDIDKEKAKILAQIIGFCMGDGHISFTKPTINREIFPLAIFVGFKEDMEKLKQDISELGFNSYLIKRYNNFYQLNSKGIFARILISSGCPTGDKVSKKFMIPKWILNTDKNIKSHFLKGLFGAELSKTRIHHYNHRDIRPFTFAQNKTKELKKDFKKYLRQLKKILKELDINTNNIKIKDKIIRKKDNKQTIEGAFDITNSRINLIKFLSQIGYIYSFYKEYLGRKTLSYLIFKDVKIRKKESLKKIAFDMYNKEERHNKKYKKKRLYDLISKKIDIAPHTIKGWISYGKGKKENHVSIKDIPKFKDFNTIMPSGLIPYKIMKKEEIQYKGYVYDLEIKDTHNYFVEGFLTHNCIHPTGEIQS